MTEAIAGAIEQPTRRIEFPQFSLLVERTKLWWDRQGIKNPKDFVSAIPRLTFGEPTVVQWHETLARLRSLAKPELSNFLTRRINCPPSVADNLAILVEGSKPNQTELTTKQRQAAETIIGEMARVSGEPKETLEDIILSASTTAGGEPPPYYQRFGPPQPASGGKEPARSQKEPEKKPPPKKPLLPTRPDKFRFVTGAGCGLLLAICISCSVFAWYQGTSGLVKEKTGIKDIPASYEELLNDPRVQALLSDPQVRSLDVEPSIPGPDGTFRTIRDRLLFSIDRTDAYLREGTTDNWQNLLAPLTIPETGPIPGDQMLSFLGQRLALQKAGCLSPDGYINVKTCDTKPGFKNLDPEVKQEYIKKYNQFVNRDKKTPTKTPIPPPSSSIPHQGVSELLQARRKMETGLVKTQAKMRRSIYRPKA